MNKSRLLMGVLSSVVVLGSVSQAHAETTGFELGGRIGYGIPMGKATGEGTNSNLADGIKGMIPLQLDIGYRAIPSLMVGGYVMYGFGFTGDSISEDCDRLKGLGVDASCSTHDVRLGIQAQYHFTPDGKLDPWIGAGIGYEWLTFGVDFSSGGASVKTSTTGNGVEFINLQGGADFALAPGFGLGPFLSLSVGQYSETSTSCDGSGCTPDLTRSATIDKKAIHEWLTLGVRGTFVL